MQVGDVGMVVDEGCMLVHVRVRFRPRPRVLVPVVLVVDVHVLVFECRVRA